MTHRRRFNGLARLLAASIAASALAAPTALASPEIGPVVREHDRAGGPVVVGPASQAPARTIEGGFDWASAAIGAGGAGAPVLLVSLGGFRYASHQRIRVAP